MNTPLRNQDWQPGDEHGNAPTWERVIVAVLLDIRAELRTLNAVFACWQFQDVPKVLRAIRKNTAQPRKAKKAKR